MLGDGREKEGERLLSYGKEEGDQKCYALTKRSRKQGSMRRCQGITERKRERG